MTDLTPVESSNIKAIGYDEATETLTVKFLTDKEYEYSGVEKEHFHKMLLAESVGKYFHREIRPNFECKKKRKE